MWSRIPITKTPRHPAGHKSGAFREVVISGIQPLKMKRTMVPEETHSVQESTNPMIPAPSPKVIYSWHNGRWRWQLYIHTYSHPSVELNLVINTHWKKCVQVVHFLKTILPSYDSLNGGLKLRVSEKSFLSTIGQILLFWSKAFWSNFPPTTYWPK